MYILLSIVGIMAAIAIVAVVRERRRRRRIAALIRRRGGRIIDFGLPLPPEWQRTVRFIGSEGDLRQVVIPMKDDIDLHDLHDERPEELVLRDEFERGGMLDRLVVVARCKELPGHAAYEKIMRSLAQGEVDRVLVREQDPSADAQARFAPVLQCLEAASLGEERRNRFELVVDGQAVDVQWHVEGDPPERVLHLRAEPRRRMSNDDFIRALGLQASPVAYAVVEVVRRDLASSGVPADHVYPDDPVDGPFADLEQCPELATPIRYRDIEQKLGVSADPHMLKRITDSSSPYRQGTVSALVLELVQVFEQARTLRR